MSYDSHGNQICLLSSEIFLFIAQLDGLIYQGNHCILVSILLLDIINFEVFYLYAFSCVMLGHRDISVLGPPLTSVCLSWLIDFF
jgi:hypothetical protein